MMRVRGIVNGRCRGGRPAGEGLAPCLPLVLVPVPALVLVLILAIPAMSQVIGGQSSGDTPWTLRAPAFAEVAGDGSAVELGLSDAPISAAFDTLRLTLAGAIARARESSPRLAWHHDLVAAAEAARAEARAAGLPALDWSAGYTRLSDAPAFDFTIPGVGRQVIAPNIPDAWRSRLSLSLPLFTGGRISGLRLAATHERTAAGFDLAGASSDLVSETTAAYWSLVLARARVDVLVQGLNAYRRHLFDVQNRLNAGLAARSDLLAVQVECDRAELARLQATSGAVVAQENLRRLLGLESSVVILATDSLAADDGPPAYRPVQSWIDARLDSLTGLARNRRADRQALAARLRAAEARARAARGARWPQLAAAAGYDDSRPNRRYNPLEDRWKESWDVSAQLSWALLDFGRTSAAVRRADQMALALRHQAVELDGAIRCDVALRVRALDTADLAVFVAERAAESARENARVVGDRFREGVCTSSDLLDAEVLFLRAGLEALDARVQSRLARADLERSLGSQ